MPLENETIATDENSGAAETRPAREERPERAERIDDRHHRLNGRDKKTDLRSTLKDVFKEAKETDKTPVTPREKAPATTADSTKDRGDKSASSSTKEIPSAPKAGETAPDPASQVPEKVAAPAALSKEVKAIWDTLPPAVQSEFAKREADTAKGVEQLKAKYKPIDDALAPVQGQLKQLGKTEAEAVSQLIGWQSALANPRTQAQAFRALAQAHNFDLQTLIAPKSDPGSQPNPNTDPTQAFRQYLDPVTQKVTQLETELQRRDRVQVESDIANMSKDKPHFEKVRKAMGLYMQNGLATGETPKEAFDKAYEMACRADPEIFTSIQQEEQAKREADAKAAQDAATAKAATDAEEKRTRDAAEVAKARKAGIGPRSGSPSGMAIAASAKGQSVGDSLRKAISERRGQV